MVYYNLQKIYSENGACTDQTVCTRPGDEATLADSCRWHLAETKDCRITVTNGSEIYFDTCRSSPLSATTATTFSSICHQWIFISCLDIVGNLLVQFFEELLVNCLEEIFVVLIFALAFAALGNAHTYTVRQLELSRFLFSWRPLYPWKIWKFAPCEKWVKIHSRSRSVALYCLSRLSLLLSQPSAIFLSLLYYCTFPSVQSSVWAHPRALNFPVV